MFCKKCGKQISDSRKLCEKCEALAGASAVRVQGVSEVSCGPKMRKEVDMGLLIKGGAQIFLGIAFFSASKYTGFFGIAAAVILCLIGTFMMISSYRTVYSTLCPYCQKSITVEKNCIALNCPVCRERVLFENYRGVPKSSGNNSNGNNC